MTRRNSLLLLDSRYITDFTNLATQLDAIGIRVFETFRSNADQNAAFLRGASKARAGESPHGWGLAVDFVPYGPTGWHWPPANDPIWTMMHGIVDTYPRLSSRPGPDIKWDSPHVEVVNWKAMRSTDWRRRLQGQK